MTISLQKGQKLSLKKENGSALARIFLGLGWDPTPSAGQVDLDASAALYDAGNSLIETVYFGALKSSDGSIRHSGDNLTGDGEGDDEQIVVDLDAVSAKVQTIFFTVTSYRGQTFDIIDSAFVRVVDSDTQAEICKYNLSDQTPTTGMIMAKIYRYNGEWKVAALGVPADGTTVNKLKRAMDALLV
jgi:tellurium resistance protein TerZ